MDRHPLQNHNSLLKWLGRPAGSVIVVFAVALLVRVLVLLALHGSPYWSDQLVDAKLYDDWARGMANGESPHPAPYFYSPVYPWALSVLYRIFGHSLTIVRLLQCALGSALCVLVCLLARRLLSWQAALGAGLFCALSGILAFYDNLLLKTAPVTFLLLAGVYLLHLDPQKKALRLGRYLLAGALLGLAADMRGNAFLVAAAVLLFLIVEALRKKAFLSPLLFGAGLAVSILPLTFANYAASGEFILTTYSGGFNFYEGNSAEATGYHPALVSVRQTASHEHLDAVAAARKATGKDPSPGEVSTYWSARAWRDIGRDPGRWLRLLALKTALFANGAEIPDNYNYAFISKRLTPLRFNLFGFYLLAPFAIAGLGMAISRGGRWRLPVLVVLTYAGSVILFYVTARYRAPLVPFLAVMAALAVEQIVRWIREQDFQRALIICVAIFGLFVAVLEPLLPQELGFGREYYTLGNLQFQQGEPGRAIESYVQALEYHPNSAQIENNLGAACLKAAQQGKTDEIPPLGIGIIHLQRAVKLKPGYFEAWKNLGIAHAVLGETESAQDAFRRALQLAPDRQQWEKVRQILESISQ